jgi:hypothetical protein
MQEISWKCWSSWKSVVYGLSSALSAKGVLRLTLLPVADGARLLGIHPKTLCHWLKTAYLPLAAHPTDARIRGVAQADLLEVARLHSRPLPHLSTVPALESYAASALAEEQGKPLPAVASESAHRAALLSTPCTSLADLREQLSHLQTYVATLQQQLADLALEFLPERTGRSEHRLRTLQGRLSQPLESFQATQETDVAGPLAPSARLERRLLPAEVRARSRVTALIEYGAHGQYVAVCPKLGVLSLTPDSPEWFDWLASLTSFRGCRDQQGAFRLVVPLRKGSTPAVGLPGAFCMGTTSGTILASLTA